MRVGLMVCRGETVGVGVRCPLTAWGDPKAENFEAIDG